MKKVLAIALTSLFILTSTEFRQLLKLPVLVQHFFEHRQEDPAFGIWEFFVMHYLSGDVRDADYDRDQQLPFKQHNHQQVQEDITPPSQALSQQLSWNANIFKAKKSFSSPFLLVSSAFLSSVWRPPIQHIG